MGAGLAKFRQSSQVLYDKSVSVETKNENYTAMLLYRFECWAMKKRHG